MPINAAPRLLNRAHTVHVGVEIPEAGAEGVLVCQGGVDGGYTFYVADGKLHYGCNYVADLYFSVVSDSDVPAGRHILSLEFQPTGEPEPLKGLGSPATVTLFVDGQSIGSGDLPVTIPLSLGLAGGVSVGRDAGAPVIPDYGPPFAFSGSIAQVVYDVTGELVKDLESEIRVALARQ